MRFLILLICLTLNASAQITAQVNIFDINTAVTGSSNPYYITEFDGRLCFIANDGVHGDELWCIDTLTGAKIVADVDPVNAVYNACVTFNQHMAVAFVDSLNKDALFYIFYTDAKGYELYRYDGISAPVMVKEFASGRIGINSDCRSNMVTIKNNVYFNEVGKGVWKYHVDSGTASLIPKSDFSQVNIKRFVVFKDRLYVNKQDIGSWDKLYVYNETADSFEMAFNINQVKYARVIDDKMYFITINNTSGTYGELYQYDGTNTPVKIADAVMEVNGYTNEREFIGSYKGKIYFQGLNSDLYEYDPVSQQKRLIVKSAKTGPYMPVGFIEYRDKLYFSAYDDVHGRELWEWDGVNPPKMSLDLFTGSMAITNANPENLHVLGDALYFRATSYSMPTIGCEIHSYKPWLASVQRLSFNGEAKLYPNPTINITTLELSLPTAQALSVDVYCMDGRIALTVPAAIYSPGISRISLEVGDLPAGSYFYHVRNNENATIVSGKLIKQ